MKKSFFILSIIILITLLSACDENLGTLQETINDIDIIESEVSETVIGDIGDKPDIAKEDYAGRRFNLYYINWSLYRDYYFADSMNGDIINDAAYERVQKVEEHLNVDITTIAATIADGAEEQYNNLQKVVMAGDTEYDLLLTHNSSHIKSFVSESLVLNWQDIESADMSKSYWNQSAVDNLSVAGMTPFAANDFILPDVNAIFFNAGLSADLQQENLYDLVLNGDWTWDKITELSASASADVNGDGVFDDKDRYGFVGEIGWQFASIPTSGDQFMIIPNSDGTPVLNINTPKMVGLMEKINMLVNGGNNSFVWPFSQATDPNQGGTPPVSFDSGRALFYLVPMSLAKVFRMTDVDFGILPLPKYDEYQTDYTTLNWAGFLCVPFTASDPELTGKVADLLAYYSKTTVIPAFYDIVLGQKISRSDESTKMLDIIFAGTVYDMGISLGSTFYLITNNLVNNNNNDFASYYAKNENIYIELLKDHITACEKYMQN